MTTRQRPKTIDPKQTLQDHVTKLTKKERALLCAVLNSNDGQRPVADDITLPFFMRGSTVALMRKRIGTFKLVDRPLAQTVLRKLEAEVQA